HRFHGGTFDIPHYTQFEPLEVMEAVIEHLSGPKPGEEQRRAWLIENACLVEEVLRHTALARNRQMLLLSDAVIGKANYIATGKADACVAKLERRDDVLPDEPSDEDLDHGFNDAWDWFEKSVQQQVQSEHRQPDVLLGRILLGEDRWRLNATGSKRLAELR